MVQKIVPLMDHMFHFLINNYYNMLYQNTKYM